MPHDVMQAAKLTCENFTRLSICEGKKPQTIAGVALFMVTMKMKRRREHDALADISTAVDIGQNTIKECY